MTQLRAAILIAVSTTVATVSAAVGESSTIGVLITSDRDPGEFAVPKSTKYELNGAHTFDNGLILGGSFQDNDRAFSDRTRENLEGTIGYRVPFINPFRFLAALGSASIGARTRAPPFHITSCALVLISTSIKP